MAIPDPSDTLGDPVVEQTVKKPIETAGRLVAKMNVTGSEVTHPMERLTIQEEWSSRRKY